MRLVPTFSSVQNVARKLAAADKAVFVGPNGADTNDGKSLGEAFLTVGAAATAVGAGGTVYVLPGTYTATGLTDLSQSGLTVICDPNARFQKAASMTTAAFTFSGSNMSVYNLVMDGNKINGATGTGLNITGTGKMVGCKASNNANHGIHVTGTLDAFDCEAHYNTNLAVTTLTGSIGTGDTTITVGSTTGFGSSGTIMIDDEVITFSGTTATTFTGCTRGTGSNPAALHSAGVRVDRVTAGAVHGFNVSGGGLLRAYGTCRANFNSRSGFHFASDASQSCVLNGEAERNHYAGANLQSPDGRGGRFVAKDNDFYGLVTDTGCVRWQIDAVQANNTGFTIRNVSGTGVELFGTSATKLGTVISKRNGGYGLAFSKDAGGTASTSNTVGFAEVDHVGAFDRDPGIHFSGGASKNHVGEANVRGSTYAVSMGELVTPDSNNDNVISTLYASDCTHAVWRNNGGSHNTIGQIIARDCTFDGVFSLALVYMHGQSTTVTDNHVGSFQHRNTTGVEPTYFVQDGGASSNAIIATW